MLALLWLIMTALRPNTTTARSHARGATPVLSMWRATPRRTSSRRSKSKFVDRHHYKSRAEARTAIFRWMAYYSHRRLALYSKLPAAIGV
jgi:hypothetical protein